MTYRFADRTIASELPLPELPEAVHAQADWHVVVAASPVPAARRPYHYWVTAAGARWASFAHDGDRLVLHFARTAAFVVDEQARTVACHPVGRTRLDAIRPVLLNQVLPLVFGAERLVLHASAVQTPAGAVVFAGAPGMGKSTVAAALALQGLPLITDDALIVDQHDTSPRAVASNVEPRLWPDSAQALMPSHRRRFPAVGRRTTKRRISPAVDAGLALASGTSPIARVYLLASSPPPATRQRITPAAAVALLTACTFVARVDEDTMIRNTFARVTALVSRVPVFRLGIVRDFSQLDALCQTVCAPA